MSIFKGEIHQRMFGGIVEVKTMAISRLTLTSLSKCHG